MPLESERRYASKKPYVFFANSSCPFSFVFLISSKFKLLLMNIYRYILLFLLQVLTSSIFGLIMCRKLDTQLLARPYLRVLFMFCSYIVINMVIYFLSSSTMYGKFNIFNPTLTLLIKYYPFNGLKNNYLGFI